VAEALVCRSVLIDNGHQNLQKYPHEKALILDGISEIIDLIK